MTEPLSPERLAEILRWHVDCECGCAEVAAEVDRLHSWAGLMALLDEHWPDDIFITAPDPEDYHEPLYRRDPTQGGAWVRANPGVIITGLIRWVDRLTRENTELRGAWDNHATNGCAGTDRLERENTELRAKVARVETLVPMGYRAEMRMVLAADIRAALSGDVAQPEPPKRCDGTVGSKPWWMGVDQYVPCRCKLPYGHDGGHACEHGSESVAQPEEGQR